MIYISNFTPTHAIGISTTVWTPQARVIQYPLHDYLVIWDLFHTSKVVVAFPPLSKDPLCNPGDSLCVWYHNPGCGPKLDLTTCRILEVSTLEYWSTNITAPCRLCRRWQVISSARAPQLGLNKNPLLFPLKNPWIRGFRQTINRSHHGRGL